MSLCLLSPLKFCKDPLETPCIYKQDSINTKSFRKRFTIVARFSHNRKLKLTRVKKMLKSTPEKVLCLMFREVDPFQNIPKNVREWNFIKTKHQITLKAPFHTLKKWIMIHVLNMVPLHHILEKSPNILLKDYFTYGLLKKAS